MLAANAPVRADPRSHVYESTAKSVPPPLPGMWGVISVTERDDLDDGLVPRMPGEITRLLAYGVRSRTASRKNPGKSCAAHEQFSVAAARFAVILQEASSNRGRNIPL